MAAVATAFFGSLQHEATHRHPTRSQMLNASLVFPGLTLVIPFLRFRDTHLDHHHDSLLTDPYDDPESNFLDPSVWERLPRPMQVLCRFNNHAAWAIDRWTSDGGRGCFSYRTGARRGVGTGAC